MTYFHNVASPFGPQRSAPSPAQKRAPAAPRPPRVASKPAAKPKPAPAPRKVRPATAKPSRAVPCSRPKVGTKRSGIIYRDDPSEGAVCGASGEAAKAKRKDHQRRMWDSGRIPTGWPRPYRRQRTELDPTKPVVMTAAEADKTMSWWKGLTPNEKKNQKKDKPNPSEIPVARVGDPDLAWFVDPRVAGAKAGKILVMFSGGKDSLALLLYACEVLTHEFGLDPRDHVEVWHQAVDGRPAALGGEHSVSEGSYRDTKWDWPVTEAYVRAICECLGLPLYFGWREGGLQGTVLKGEKAPEGRAAAAFEVPSDDGSLIAKVSGRSVERERMSYPLISADLKARWCSSEAKIDTAESQLTTRKDLYGKRILYLSGERAEESSNRATYAEREYMGTWAPGDGFNGAHQARGRHVEKWRPIHRWCELDVWAIIARWGIRPHPAYSIGFGRLSCMTCIFGSPRQWATVKKIDPTRFGQFLKTEQVLLARKEADVAKGVPSAEKRLPTIKSKKERGRTLPVSLSEFARGAPSYDATERHPQLVREAMSTKLLFPLIQRPWKLPAGAFGEDTGPI